MAKPVVFWISSPADPGETVLIYGAGLENTTFVQVVRLPDGDPGSPDPKAEPDFSRAESVPPIQPSEVSVKFILPKYLTYGVFAVRVKTRSGCVSNPLYLNLPDLWWCQGDAGDSATPDGWIRLFGRHVVKGKRTVSAHLSTDAAPRAGPIPPSFIRIDAAADTYAAKINLTHLPPGNYHVCLHNGFGGRLGWSSSLSIKVAARDSWPTEIWNVRDRDIGAKGDGQSDDSEAIQAALDLAHKNGGGTVFFPRGRYKLTKQLEVYERTVLRGEKDARELSHLYWTTPSHLFSYLKRLSPDGSETDVVLPNGCEIVLPDCSKTEVVGRLPYVIRGRSHFGLEDLTLTFAGADNGILSDLPRLDFNYHFHPKEARNGNPEATTVFLHRVTSHDLAAVIDPLGGGTARSVGVIKRGEDTSCVYVAMAPRATVDVISHDLAAVIDPEGHGRVAASGGTDRGEDAPCVHETIAPGAVDEMPYDLAAVIDPVGVGNTRGSNGVINRCVDPPRFPGSQ
jgi:hypothetical protein